MIGRPTVATFVVATALATLTVTALALAMPGAPAPQAHDLPRIVSEQPLAPNAGGVTATPADASSAVTKTVPVAPAKAGAPAGAGKPAHGASGSGSKKGTGSSGTSGDSHASDGHDSSSGGHSGGEHEVVAPHLHESDEGSRDQRSH